MGKELLAHFLQAGFTDARASASYDYFGTPQDVAFLHGFILEWFHAPRVVAAAVQHGLATQEQFDEWRRDLDEWKDMPAAFGAMAFGECLAAKP